MTGSSVANEGATDIAALSAAIIAVTVSLFVTPGEFGVINFMVSFTITTIVYGYVWYNRRGASKSVALASIISFGLIPAVGFIDEGLRSHRPIKFLTATYEWRCGGVRSDPCKQGGDHVSRVKDSDLALLWIIILLIVFTADRLDQNKRYGIP